MSAPFDDPYDAALVRSAAGPLRVFNEAGILAPADVHVATTLGRLVGEADPQVVLAVAFAVRAPRLGHVLADLSLLRATVVADEAVDLDTLPWPDVDAWLRSVAASPIVCSDPAPLHLAGSRLYLDRYWRYERSVATSLRARAALPAERVDTAVLAAGLDRLFPSAEDDLQRRAAATAVRRRFAVIAGGPGTGKTTTVARVLALLDEQAHAAAAQPPRVALAAPTGKAAARLQEAVRAAAGALDVGATVQARLDSAEASTIHRLLRWRPGSRTRFRYHGGSPLPHDVVVVDETSMVSLALMAKLLDAVRAETRLVLVGDPEQLASVEAGTVLGDIVGPAGEGRGDRTGPAGAGPAGSTAPASADAAVADGIVVLRRFRRFDADSGIAVLADAVQRGDADAAMGALEAGTPDVTWLPLDAATAEAHDLAPLRAAVVAGGAHLLSAAREGDGRAALRALAGLRILCAHRHGTHGVASWVATVEQWLTEDVPGFVASGPWYVGRPVLVTANDYRLRLFNGDTGVVLADGDGGRTVAFDEPGGGIRRVAPSRLESVQTVHAMTIHKSQGSQFRSVAVVLPDPTSPILTRELLYTAVTRAQERLIIVAAPDAVRTAVAQPIQRASALEEALWR